MHISLGLKDLDLSRHEMLQVGLVAVLTRLMKGYRMQIIKLEGLLAPGCSILDIAKGLKCKRIVVVIEVEMNGRDMAVHLDVWLARLSIAQHQMSRAKTWLGFLFLQPRWLRKAQPDYLQLTPCSH